PLIHQLLGSGDRPFVPVDIFSTNLILAGRWLALCFDDDNKDLYTPIRNVVITCLKELLKSTPYILTEEQAAETLAEIGQEEINTYLLQEILANEQERPDIRRSVARALGKFGERSLAPLLLKLLINEKIYRSVRRSIAIALGELAEPEMT